MVDDAPGTFFGQLSVDGTRWWDGTAWRLNASFGVAPAPMVDLPKLPALVHTPAPLPEPPAPAAPPAVPFAAEPEPELEPTPVPAQREPEAAAPLLSPDGRHVWDGHDWQPVAPAPQPTALPDVDEQLLTMRLSSPALTRTSAKGQRNPMTVAAVGATILILLIAVVALRPHGSSGTKDEDISLPPTHAVSDTPSLAPAPVVGAPAVASVAAPSAAASAGPVQTISQTCNHALPAMQAITTAISTARTNAQSGASNVATGHSLGQPITDLQALEATAPVGSPIAKDLGNVASVVGGLRTVLITGSPSDPTSLSSYFNTSFASLQAITDDCAAAGDPLSAPSAAPVSP